MKDIKLLPHQMDVLRTMVTDNVQQHIYDIETGLGKTVMGLSLLEMYPQLRILVVTKALLVKQAWILDSGRFNQFKTSLRQITSANMTDIHKYRVCICSFAIFRAKHKEFKKVKWDMVIVDESHRMARYNGVTTKAFTGSQYCGKMVNGLDVDRRILMSGTSIPNHRHQVFSQLQYVGYPKLWREFKAKFFIQPDPRIGWLKFRHSMTEAFNEELKPYMTVVTKRMAGISDEKVFNIIPYCLPEKVMEFYEKLRTGGYARWEGHDITIDYKITEGMRLRQISKGYIRDTDGNLLRVSEIPRLMFKDYISDRASSFPYVVVYQEDPELADIEQALTEAKIQFRSVHGKMSSTQQDNNIEEFKTWKKGVLVGQAETISEGLSVNNTNRITFYALDHDLRKFSQVCDRISGIQRGMGLVPHYDVFQCVDTIDEVIYNGLLNKADMIRSIKHHIQTGEI